MTAQEKGLLQQVIEHVLRECEPCREDIADLYAQYPGSDWFWSIACELHRTPLRESADAWIEIQELETAIPILERVAKGKELLNDKKLSLKKAMEYKEAIADLMGSVPKQYRGAVILDLQKRLDNIRTDMLYWLKPG